MNPDQPLRLAYLSPTHAPYRVPFFSALYRALGEDFVVVTLKHQSLYIDQIAQAQSCYPRILLEGRRWLLSRHHDRGLQTPLGLTVAPGLPRALRRFRPDVVISDNFSLWSLTAIVLGYPTVLFWEGTRHTERTVRAWRQALRRWMAARAVAFASNGSLASDYLEQALRVDRRRIRVTRLCPASPPLPTETGDRAGPLRFLFVGRLVAGKGVLHLLRATAALKAEVGDRDFSVRLVGDGPERASLERLARRLGIRSVVHFAGGVHPLAVWQQYAAAEVFVLPTLQDNGPVAALEAAVMGLPLLLSKYAGLAPDLIEDGVNGHIFDPADHAALARYMACYIREPGLARRQGRVSRDGAARFTPQQVTDAFLETARQARVGVRA